MKRNIAIPLAALCCLMLAGLMLLPLVHFTSALETKRSPNTFVGDEKYQTVRQEMAEKQQEYAALGVKTELSEEVIQRQNSKGETTSLVVFRISSENTRTGLQLLGAGMTVSRVMTAMLACALGTLCMGLAGCGLKKRERAAKGCFSLGVALALAVPVLAVAGAMRFNVDFSRRVTLLLNGNLTGDGEACRQALDRFLYNGQAGAQLDQMLGTLRCSLSPRWWLTLIPAFGLMTAALGLRCKTVGQPLGRVALYAAVILFSLFILYPFFVMLVTAFRSNAETTDMYFLRVLPERWIWSNLTETLNRGVLRYLGNSLLISFGATAIAMFCGIPAAYAMARMRFRGRKTYLGFVIMSQMFSPVVLLVGISRLMSTLGLNDTLWGLMFINAAFNQAFAIWLLRGTFVSISPEMEQASCIDGCNTLQALIRILLPMAAPGIVTTLIFVFINSWNEYTISTILISTQTRRPITVGITQFSSFNMIEWQYLFAAALMATIPVVILFMCIEKHLAEGLTAGGVKG